MTQQSSGSLKWLLIVLAIVIILGGSYLVYLKYGNLSNPVISASPTGSATPGFIAPSDWKSYTNTKYGYSVKIPAAFGSMSSDNKISQTLDPNLEQINFGEENSPNPSNANPVAVFSIAVTKSTLADALKPYESYDRTTDVNVGPSKNIKAKLVQNYFDMNTGKSLFNDETIDEIYFIEHNGLLYTIKDNPKYGQDITGANIDQIMTTFQFTQ